MEKISWRIALIIIGILTMITYFDNRQQEKLLFKTIDIVEENTNQITQLGEFDSNINQIEFNNLEIIQKLLKKGNVR
jgi:hypothetical protein